MSASKAVVLYDPFEIRDCVERGASCDVPETLVSATDYDALQSEVARLRAAQAWMPIESAPQNEAVLVYWDWPKGAASHVNDVAIRRGRDWYASGDPVVTPTHWMPLPPAPDSEALAREGQ